MINHFFGNDVGSVIWAFMPSVADILKTKIESKPLGIMLSSENDDTGILF